MLRQTLIVAFSCWVGLGVCGSGLRAQAPPPDSIPSHALEAVVITGQHGAVRASRAPHRVRIIDRARMEAQGAVTLAEVLGQELGLRINQDPALGAQIQMQGISGQNVKILLDGMPVPGRLGGALDLSQLPLQDIERIEIVEGPMSVEFGTNALAGVINLITRKGTQAGWTWRAGLREGTLGGGPSRHEGFHTQDVGMDWRGARQRVSLSGTRNFFGGSRAEAGLRPPSLAPKLQMQGRAAYGWQGRRGQLSAQSLWFDEELRRLGRVTGVYVPRARDEVYYTRRHQQQVEGQWRPSETHRLQAQASWAGFHRALAVFNQNLHTLESQPLPQESRLEIQRTLNFRGTWDWTLRPEQLSWQTGLDLQQEQMTGDKILSGTQVQGDYALFSSLEYRPRPAWLIRPGLRVAYNTAYPAPLSPALLLRWQARPAWVMRFSYARGFRAPSLKELYLDFVDINHEIRGNADLRAERGHYLQLSGQWQALKGIHLWRLESGLFYNDIQNKIDLVLTGSSANAASYFNVARLQATGLDLQGSWQWRGWRWQVGGMVLGRQQDPGAGAAPLQDLTGSLTVQGQWHWQATGLRLAMFYIFNGPVTSFQETTEGDLPTVTAVRMAPYQLADLTLSRRWGSVDLTLGVQNLFHVTAVNAVQQSTAHQGGNGQASVGLGRSLFARLNWEWPASSR